MLGLRIVYNVQKSVVRHEVRDFIKSGAKDSELVTFVFNKKDTLKLLNWKHSKEFSFKEVMYDVVERITVSDSIVYKCWKDTKETKLTQRYQEFFNASIKTNKPLNKSKGFVLITFNKVLNSNCFDWSRSSSIEVEKDNFHYLEMTSSTYLRRIEAPPKFINLINS